MTDIDEATPIGDPLVREQVERVPAFSRFATVDELTERFASLADAHRVARLRRIGSSRLGEPIHCLTIGGAARHAVVAAFPHPNEPIGGLTALHLATVLCEDAGLRERLGLTWHVVPCIDPDGTRLNEGWFGDVTRERYARGFYRPAPDEQIEWTFPLDYKRAYFDRVLPETLALMRLIDETRPALLSTLHNGELGGVYYYLSRAMPELYGVLHEIPLSLGLPLDLGEPEAPYIPRLAPAIYRAIRSHERYDWEEEAGVDPARAAHAGASTTDYSDRYGTLTVVCETPYWIDSRSQDDAPVDERYADVLRRQADALAELEGALSGALRDVAGDARIDSPFMRAGRAFVGFVGDLPGQLRGRAGAPEADRPATVAEQFSCAYVVDMFRLRLGGILLRALDAELGAGNATAAIRGARASLGVRYDRWIAEADRDAPSDTAPLRSLVATQHGTLIAAAGAL